MERDANPRPGSRLTARIVPDSEERSATWVVDLASRRIVRAPRPADPSGERRPPAAVG